MPLPPGGGEAARSFAVFAILAVLLAGLGLVSHSLALQDKSRLTRFDHMHRATQEARNVAEAVKSLGRGPAGLDFYRLRKERVWLERML